MVKVKYEDLSMALDFVSSGVLTDNSAYVSLDTGTIHAFDYTASRFSRDLEPIAKGVIDQRSPSLSFTLAAAGLGAGPKAVAPTPAAAAAPTAGTSRKTLGISILLVAAGVIGFLAVRRWRGIGGQR